VQTESRRSGEVLLSSQISGWKISSEGGLAAAFFIGANPDRIDYSFMKSRGLPDRKIRSSISRAQVSSI
jgi:hypothetical protein